MRPTENRLDLGIHPLPALVADAAAKWLNRAACCPQEAPVTVSEEPLTLEEAKAAYDAAEPVPISKDRIDEIVRYATTAVPRRKDRKAVS